MSADLVEFLLARIAEREDAARALAELRGKIDDHWRLLNLDMRNGAEYVFIEGRLDPARVLAECEAKRRIVELHGDQHDCVGDFEHANGWPYPGCDTLRFLALPDAAHADYRPEWRPE